MLSKHILSTYCNYCYSTKTTFNSFLLDFNNFRSKFSSTVINVNPYINYLSSSSLKIFYQNVCGLKTKVINIRCVFQMFYFYHIIVLTETWLSPDVEDAELGFFGYQVFRLDRNPNNSSFLRGEGVLIAIKFSLKSHPIRLNVTNVEQVFVVLSVNTNNLLIGCVYLSPQTPFAIVESHLSSIEHILSTNKSYSVILCGDYNIPHIKWSSDLLGLTASGDLNPISHAIIDSFSFLNFFQLNSITNTQGNCLDLIFPNLNNVSICLASEPLVTLDSYHPPLHIQFPIQALNKYSNTHTYKDFKSADFLAISRFFNHYNREATFSLYSVNDAAAIFNEALLQSIMWYVPNKIFHSPKFPKWVSPNLKYLIFHNKTSSCCI